ncbi:MAG TPA: hypothetical protein P5274_01610 [Candidatus Paceibacterota bacterium]|nr:hypothetical protein [Candidatus Paceibacterota bacterium]
MNKSLNKKLKKVAICRLIIASLFLVVVFGTARQSLAVPTVDVFLFAGSQELASDDFVVTLGLDTGSERVNAVSGVLSYDATYLDLDSISNANSIIPLWLEFPRAGSSTPVSFAGIVPGGFGGTGRIISLIFKTKGEDQDFLKHVQIKKIEVLRNDGLGQIIPTAIISPSAQIVSQLDVLTGLDQLPPEDFQPLLSQDNQFLDGQSYLIFNTTDKGSGVAKYFVAESKTKLKLKDQTSLETGVAWQEAQSPYRLQDQSLSSYVYVKAVDRAGNVLVVGLDQEKKFYQFWWFWIIIIISALSVCFWWGRKFL